MCDSHHRRPRPQPSFLRRQEPRSSQPPHQPPPPIHPSPLRGGRRGGGWEAARCPPPPSYAPNHRPRPQPPAPPQTVIRAPNRHSCAGRNSGVPASRRPITAATAPPPGVGGAEPSRRTVDSCLRRNDGREDWGGESGRWDGGFLPVQVPACAGMTEEAIGALEGGGWGGGCSCLRRFLPAQE